MQIMTPQQARTLRYSGLIDPSVLASVTLSIVGVGAVGRQLALMLAASGARDVTLFDDDTVEDHNMGTQGYWPVDIGEHKVTATAQVMEVAGDLPAGTVAQVPERVNAHTKLPGIVMCCVDSMRARRMVAMSMLRHMTDPGSPCLIDARMLAENINVYQAEGEGGLEAYLDALYSDEDASDGRCTTRMTLHGAAACASFMVSGLWRRLRGLPSPVRVSVDLLATSMETEWSTSDT